MVDSTSGLGPVQNIASSSRAQSDNARRGDNSGGASAPQTDAVEISPQAQNALDVAQSEQAATRAAQDTRTELEQNLDLVLGIDPSFVEQLGES